MGQVFDFSTFPEIITDRLHLRQLTPEDSATIMAIYGSPQVLEFLNLDPVDTPEKALGLINWFQSSYERHEAVQWAITLPESDTMVGTCGIYDWHQSDRHVDIGYQILPAHWGKGYATEATRAMVDWCFANLNVHRIQADCTDGNLGSERVLLKCGFTVEGIWRESCWEHGRFVNIKQFGLLEREFKT